MTPDLSAGSNEPGLRCAQCQARLVEGQDHEQTDDGVFCRACYEQLAQQVRQAFARQSQDVNYAMAVVGGLAGGAIGVVAWWGFTVLTQIAFGLVAVVIGFTVGKGVTILSGHKRSRALQAMSCAIATVSFFYASYLVNRSLVHRAWRENGQDGVLPWVPGLNLGYEVVALSFGIMDLVFMAIVVYQAWKIPAPVTFET